MNHLGIPSQHPSEFYRPRVSTTDNQERLARAALQHVPGAKSVIDRVFSKESRGREMTNPPKNLIYYTGFDKQH
jgi:hypothetical protein